MHSGYVRQKRIHTIRCFYTDFNSEKEISRARIYVTGLGVYEAYLNGEKIGDGYLAPF